MHFVATGKIGFIGWIRLVGLKNWEISEEDSCQLFSMFQTGLFDQWTIFCYIFQKLWTSDMPGFEYSYKRKLSDIDT